MRKDRAIDLIAREVVARGDSISHIKIIYSPIGAENIKLVLERAEEVRRDLSPQADYVQQAFEQLSREKTPAA